MAAGASRSEAPRALVFDVDGTLIDTLAPMAQALNGLLTSIGRAPWDLARVRDQLSLGLDGLLAAALQAGSGAPARADLGGLQADLLQRYQALAPGEAEDKEKAGRYRLLDIAQRDGMAAMAADWSRGMVYPPRLADAELMQAIQSMIARAGVERFAAQIRALLQRPDRTALLASLRLPTLLLCGHDDSWSPLARHEDMKRLIAGSTLVAVPECGHMSTMERPEAVSAAMIDWMQS